MMTIKTGSSTWFTETGTRLDASFHLSEARQAKIQIDKSPLGSISLHQATQRVFLGGRFTRVHVSDSTKGYPYLTASDMMKSEPFSSSYLSRTYTKNLDKLVIRKGWILLSCSGSIGRTVYTNDLFEGQVGTHDLIRIVPNTDKLPGGYLYAFLSSKLGYALLTQGTYGGVIQHIEPHHIADLHIPILPHTEQQAIHAAIERAAQLRVEANFLLSEAMAELDNQYPVHKTGFNIFSVTSSDLLNGDKFTKETRLEADFYKPEIAALRKKIQTNNHQFLGDLSLEIHTSGLRERKFVADGIPLFTGQSLGLLNPDYGKFLSRKLTRNIEANTTRDKDIIVSSLGSIGYVELAYKNFYTGVFVSQQTTRIRVDEEKIHPGYIFLFLKSLAGQRQIIKYKTGSVIEWVRTNNIASILVPIPEDRGERLGKIAYEVCEKRQEAYELEIGAISRVEELVGSW